MYEELKRFATKLIQYKKGDFLFRQGEEVKGLFLVEDGVLKIVQRNRTGKIVFSRLAFPKDTVGHRSIFIQKTYSGTAEILSASAKVYFFPAEKISSLLAGNAGFARQLIIKIAKELQRAEEEQIQTKEKTAHERLSGFLYEVGQNYAEKSSDGRLIFKSAISKKNIAQSLLLADETVIRLMADLESEKIIGYENKKIVIVDSKKLAENAAFS
jgi:CRP/FNR family transcriptional regulator, polysaccharide utilization system transcription regulator